MPKVIKKQKNNKYVAFKNPDINWDGLDWVYNLLENPTNGRFGLYDFLLIESETPALARERAAEFFYEKLMRSGGVENIIEEAFMGLRGLELEDGEILNLFGESDGKAILEFYEKYTWDAFMNEDITFYKTHKPLTLDPADRMRFYNFNQENLEKLYKDTIKCDILIMPITKELI